MKTNTKTIYVVHATSFDFRQELYAQLKALSGDTVKFIFPHELSDAVVNSKELIAQADLVLAEVSYPSTGSGIELGWANMLNIPVVCIHRADCKPSSSVRVITDKIIAYHDINELADFLD